MWMMREEDLCRIVLLGLPGVGKTAITVRLITNRFIGEYCPSLESIYTYRTEIKENTEVKLELFDTAGYTDEQGDRGKLKSYALWGNCFVYIYSITDRYTFEGAARLKMLIDKFKPGDPSYLVGNKVDLALCRQVALREGEHMARRLNCEFCEISAASGSDIDDIKKLFKRIYLTYQARRTSKLSDIPSPMSPSKDKRDDKTHSEPNSFRKVINKVIVGKRFITKTKY